MKSSSFIIVIILLLTVKLSFAQSQKTNVNEHVTHAFINNIVTNEFKEAKKHLHPVLKLIVTKNFLQTNFTAKIEAHGSLEMQAIKAYTKSGLILPIIFTTDSIEEYVKFHFDSKNRIDGLAFVDNDIQYPAVGKAQGVDDFAKAYLDFKNNTKSALAIGIYANGVKHYFTYGNTNKINGSPIDTNTQFQIGSITKLFTASLLALDSQLITKPISDYLPDTLPALQYKKQAINFLDLATHTSGLPEDPTNLIETNLDDPYATYGEADMLCFIKTYTLSNKIAAKYNYSNLGFGLLGYILSSNTATSYEDLIQKNICEPLKLAHTTTLAQHVTKNKVQSYYGKQALPDFTFTNAMIGAGGVYSSVSNMLTFGIAHLQPAETTIEQSLLFTQKSFRHVKINYQSVDMGLGWMKLDYNNREILIHPGNTYGTSSVILLDKINEIAVVIMANSYVPVNDMAYKILDFLSLSK